MNKRGTCIAIDNYYDNINDCNNEIFTQKLIFAKGEVFEFVLKDDWYHLEKLEYPIQSILFDKYFKIIK